MSTQNTFFLPFFFKHTHTHYTLTHTHTHTLVLTSLALVLTPVSGELWPSMLHSPRGSTLAREPPLTGLPEPEPPGTQRLRDLPTQTRLLFALRASRCLVTVLKNIYTLTP